MSFFALWHPLRKEDDHTALVFGFLRHAPVEAALGPWLTDVLGRSVSPPPLLPEDFWPRYPSLDEQTSATVPDLVFETDGRDSDWVLDEIPWQPGDGPSDVRWVLDRLEAGAEVWRDAP